MRNLFIFAKHTKARESICIWRNYLHMHLPCPVPTIGMYDHHVQLSDHSICCECLRKCSAGHASTAHKRHFLGPASAGLQPFVAAPRMVPAHVQSDSMMKDTRHQVSHYLKVSAALTQPSWTFLPESSPSHRFLLPETDNTVIYSIWYTDRWSAKKHHKSWLYSVGSILVSDPPPHPKSLQPQPLLVHPEGKLALGMRKTWPFFLLAFPFSTCCKPVLANAKLDQSDFGFYWNYFEFYWITLN